MKIVARTRLTDDDCPWPGIWYIKSYKKLYSLIWETEHGKMFVRHEKSMAYAMQFITDMVTEPRLVAKEMIEVVKRKG